MTTFKVTIDVSATTANEAASFRDAIEKLMPKWKASGFVALLNKYQKDQLIKISVDNIIRKANR